MKCTKDQADVLGMIEDEKKGVIEVPPHDEIEDKEFKDALIGFLVNLSSYLARSGDFRMAAAFSKLAKIADIVF